MTLFQGHVLVQGHVTSLDGAGEGGVTLEGVMSDSYRERMKKRS